MRSCQKQGGIAVVVNEGRWYLVQCKPRDSFRAALNLENQGFHCFHPTYPVKRKLAGSVRVVIAPLFPHYLFILLKSTDNWLPIRSTRGVSRIVSFNGVFASLTPDMITALQQQCAKLNGQPVEPMFKPGEHVRITEGCFKEIEAIVMTTNAEERVTLLINLFHREQRIELPVQALAALR